MENDACELGFLLYCLIFLAVGRECVFLINICLFLDEMFLIKQSFTFSFSDRMFFPSDSIMSLLHNFM